MDVVLKVIEGAKSGAKLAVKKKEFLIGRSQSCHLCAGSSAISRKHCAILREDNRVSIKDLGSRNGTWVNGRKVEGEVELASGDEISVGPLKFEVTISAGIANAKRDKVNSVAEAVVRTADTPTGEFDDEDITQWLSGPSSALSETQSIHVDDTNALHKAAEAERKAASSQTGEPKAKDASDSDATEMEQPPTDGKGGKPAPGKLPKLPEKAGAKDSREAAVEALRAWSRRR